MNKKKTRTHNFNALLALYKNSSIFMKVKHIWDTKERKLCWTSKLLSGWPHRRLQYQTSWSGSNFTWKISFWRVLFIINCYICNCRFLSILFLHNYNYNMSSISLTDRHEHLVFHVLYDCQALVPSLIPLDQNVNSEQS